MTGKMTYEALLELLKYRRSIRRFKPDPIPDEYVTKILDAAHYAMSGTNAQQWEFIVVKDPEIRKGLVNAYRKYHFEEAWNLEQMRYPQYRHPGFGSPPEERKQSMDMMIGWAEAPVIIAVLQDVRKQFSSALVALYPGVEVLAKSVAHCTMLLHLAVASLGLGSQHLTMIIQQPFREVLGYPEPLTLNVLIPIGYRAYEPGPPLRLPLDEMVHYDKYDMSKYMPDGDILKYLDKVRAIGRPGYRASTGKT